MNNTPLRILYAAYARIPTEKAHGVQIVSMCDAFAALGHDVELVLPKRSNPIRKDPFSYYDVKPSFRVSYAPSLFTDISSKARFILGEVLFAKAVRARTDLASFDVVITRSSWVVKFLHSRIPVFFELHDFPMRRVALLKFLLRRAHGFISTNHFKAGKLAKLMNIRESDVLIAPNGFDPNMFSIEASKHELRKELGLPEEKSLVLYTGNLFGWKGAHVLLETARMLPAYLFVFVGGSSEEAKRFDMEIQGVTNVKHIQHQPHSRIPRYLKAADVLVLPNSASTEESRTGTSPIKLFEYMASGTPIVASRLPSICEVVSEREVMFVLPDDSKALARAIELTMTDKVVASQRARLAAERSLEYTWRVRAGNIVAFVRRKSSL